MTISTGKERRISTADSTTTHPFCFPCSYPSPCIHFCLPFYSTSPARNPARSTLSMQIPTRATPTPSAIHHHHPTSINSVPGRSIPSSHDSETQGRGRKCGTCTLCELVLGITGILTSGTLRRLRGRLLELARHFVYRRQSAEPQTKGVSTFLQKTKNFW